MADLYARLAFACESSLPLKQVETTDQSLRPDLIAKRCHLGLEPSESFSELQLFQHSLFLRHLLVQNHKEDIETIQVCEELQVIGTAAKRLAKSDGSWENLQEAAEAVKKVRPGLAKELLSGSRSADFHQAAKKLTKSSRSGWREFPLRDFFYSSPGLESVLHNATQQHDELPLPPKSSWLPLPTSQRKDTTMRLSADQRTLKYSDGKTRGSITCGDFVMVKGISKSSRKEVPWFIRIASFYKDNVRGGRIMYKGHFCSQPSDLSELQRFGSPNDLHLSMELNEWDNCAQDILIKVDQTEKEVNGIFDLILSYLFFDSSGQEKKQELSLRFGHQHIGSEHLFMDIGQAIEKMETAEPKLEFKVNNHLSYQSKHSSTPAIGKIVSHKGGKLVLQRYLKFDEFLSWQQETNMEAPPPRGFRNKREQDLVLLTGSHAFEVSSEKHLIKLLRVISPLTESKSPHVPADVLVARSQLKVSCKADLMERRLTKLSRLDPCTVLDSLPPTPATPPSVIPIPMIDVCAGGGGLSLGFEMSGAATLHTAVEKDKDCCTVLEANTKADVRHEELEDYALNLTKHPSEAKAIRKAIKLLVAGPPCQVSL